jgi:hypothetical protein
MGAEARQAGEQWRASMAAIWIGQSVGDAATLDQTNY